jgi:type I restriction enzyme S subunit
MTKLIYDYWFVQFDFPDSKGLPYKSSGGNMVYSKALKRDIPDGWDSGICSSIFKFNPKLSIKKGDVSSYIDMNALPVSGFMTKKVKRKAFSGGMKFQNGDVVVARITPCLENGKTGLISLLDENEIGFGSTEFIVLRGKAFDLRCFGACLARSEKFRKYSISKMIGTSGRKRVNYTALEDYKMAIPSESLLRDFEGKASPFFEKMTVNTKENQKLIELRDWLLPMLMNGQVTVKG